MEARQKPQRQAAASRPKPACRLFHAVSALALPDDNARHDDRHSHNSDDGDNHRIHAIHLASFVSVRGDLTPTRRCYTSKTLLRQGFRFVDEI